MKNDPYSRVLGLATMACSDDDEDNGPGGLTGRMIGTWDMTF